MAPTGLDAPDRGIGERRERTLEKVGWRYEIGVEDSKEFAARVGKPRPQGAGLVASAVGAPVLNDVDSLLPVDCDAAGDDLARIVGRVVQYLDLEPLRRVVESGGRVDQPPDDVAFIVHRQLNGDTRRLLDCRGPGRPRAGQHTPGNEG